MRNNIYKCIPVPQRERYSSTVNERVPPFRHHEFPHLSRVGPVGGIGMIKNGRVLVAT